jgi:3-phenylpropionate/trans-cinnamate dioxygenase ferredoxin subunit
MIKYELNDVQSLEQGQSRLYSFNEHKVLVYRLSDGLHATSSQCTHLFKSLEKGQIIDDKVVRCPLHRAEFDIRSGEVAKWANFPPGVQLLNVVRPEKCLSRYAIEKQGEDYFVILQ